MANTKVRVKRHKKKFTIPLAIVAGFIPMALDIKHGIDDGNGVLQSASHTLTALFGIDTYAAAKDRTPRWNVAQAAGTPAIVMGFLAHFAAQKLGINRMLANAGIPIVRI